MWFKKEAYGDDGFCETTDYIYRDGELQAIHRGTNSIGDNEIMMLTWRKRNIVSERMEGVEIGVTIWNIIWNRKL